MELVIIIIFFFFLNFKNLKKGIKGILCDLLLFKIFDLSR